MKLITDKTQFEKEILVLASLKPKFFYICTFRLVANRFFYEVIKSLPPNCKIKVIIGVKDSSNAFLRFMEKMATKYQMDVKIVHNFHTKMIITNNGGLIGGRNLTSSDWDDLSIKVTKKESVNALKRHFEKLYKEKKSLI